VSVAVISVNDIRHDKSADENPGQLVTLLQSTISYVVRDSWLKT